MTEIRDPIGQLFMVDFTGTVPSPQIERLIVDEGVGGVILFDKNIADPPQIASLTNALQRCAAGAGRPPLLVSADQEGGPVARLRTGATHFPSAMAFGAAGSEALVASAAGVTARELRAVGVHMNMAPVLDVNSNPSNPIIGVRSFGETPDLVARLGTAAVRGLQAAGVVATAKHFPGHGDTSQDSHEVLPVVPHPLRRIEAVELAPFRAAIAAGLGAVMTAHVLYPALDPERPATLSPAILTLLRERLEFTGLVVTDSMAMRAITGRLPPGDAAVEAVVAGCDLILALGSADAQREALAAVRRAVQDGRIPRERIEAAASRVFALKRRLRLADRAIVPEDNIAQAVGVAAHRAVADHVAEWAATLVRDRNGYLPLRRGPIAVAVEPEYLDAAQRLAGAITGQGGAAEAVAADAAAAIPPGSATVLVLDGGRASPGAAGQTRILDAARAAVTRGPTVAVSVGLPYGLAEMPSEAACLAVYGADPPSLRAAACVLLGLLVPRGRLPVSLPR